MKAILVNDLLVSIKQAADRLADEHLDDTVRILRQCDRELWDELEAHEEGL